MNKDSRKTVGFLIIGVVVTLIMIVSVMSLDREAFSEDTLVAEAMGRYQAVAPDLIINTATGEVRNSTGQVVSTAIEPQGALAGKYDAAGFMTTVTTAASLSALGRSDIQNRLVKGITVVDTSSGRIVIKQRIYYNQPLTPEDLR